MTDIEIRAEQGAELQTYQDAHVARLVAWTEQATAIQGIAEVIVRTKMCPQAYRNKPDEATAAMLAGLELGIMPMAALRAFDDIQGTPAPKAITLRAVVQARGHDLEVLESGPTKAVVEGKRKGSDRWQRVEWTIERADQAGYVAKNAKYKTDPTAQLVARATAEMARWLDSAAIMGMPYSAEEIADSTGLQGSAPSRKVSAADIVGRAVAATEPVADYPTPTWANEQQLQDIRELFQNRGIAEPTARQDFVNNITRRELRNLSSLTSDEAEQVIGALENMGVQP
jgi:hypothetical protein